MQVFYVKLDREYFETHIAEKDDQSLMKILTVGNNKGGSGKTTSCVNIAAALALLHGKEVLVVDLDPQGQAATALGCNPDPGAYYLLTMGLDKPSTNYICGHLQEARINLKLLPGDKQTAMAQAMINHPDAPKPISWIRDSLTYHFSGFDYIVMDTAPSLGGIQERAFWAADLVLLPTPAEALGADGLRQALETLKRLHSEKDWRGQLLGILPTFVTDRQREHRLITDSFEQKFGSLLLSPIHRAAILAECPAYGQTIFERQPNSRSADEYARLADQIVKGS